MTSGLCESFAAPLWHGRQRSYSGYATDSYTPKFNHSPPAPSPYPPDPRLSYYSTCITTVKVANPVKFIKAASKAVSTATGKGERWVMVSLNAEKPMVFSGTEEPAAYGELISIGAVGGEKNKMISKAIMDVITAELGVPGDRTYLKISDVARADFGYNGDTFA